ncbi:hypothetical protein THASP1DRAFT_29134 [Thamnocephalis sphaerospora]|uniref:Nuclear polyadenylated RNA-binding protein NAB2 n=1 Tax=Thamnocephalis sphaerospora TaxID=78915 RepID=A0A4P9XSH5_9FUNG|nr:hypothetical protein THASP1DRAFT_29134 [Thamnocephalis sphaerospora]|eukprot:RKP09077.1 hypothetical protein THASP1DRAFT_29134 [Thamnocephalis sphaerospora]
MTTAFVPGSPAAADLLKAVHGKLIEYGYVVEDDPVLAEYIGVMIANSRSAEDVSRELSELIGEGYDPSFAAWVFSWISQYQNATEAARVQPPAAVTHALAEAQSVGDDAEMSTPRRANAASRLLQSAVNDATRDARQTHTPRQGPKTSSLKRRQSPRRARRGASDAQEREALVTSARESAGTIPCKYGVSCNNASCTFAHPERSSAAEMPCRFYPNCLNPACPFKHGEDASFGEALAANATAPSRVVRKVPIPCRDGAECKRPNCHFLHPGEETSATSAVPCKFGAGCTRPDCKFFHAFRNKSIRFQDGQPMATGFGAAHISERSFSVADVIERMPVPNNANGTAGDDTLSSDDVEMQL